MLARHHSSRYKPRARSRRRISPLTEFIDVPSTFISVASSNVNDVNLLEYAESDSDSEENQGVLVPAPFAKSLRPTSCFTSGRGTVTSSTGSYTTGSASTGPLTSSKMTSKVSSLLSGDTGKPRKLADFPRQVDQLLPAQGSPRLLSRNALAFLTDSRKASKGRTTGHSSDRNFQQFCYFDVSVNVFSTLPFDFAFCETTFDLGIRLVRNYRHSTSTL